MCLAFFVLGCSETIKSGLFELLQDATRCYKMLQVATKRYKVVQTKEKVKCQTLNYNKGLIIYKSLLQQKRKCLITLGYHIDLYPAAISRSQMKSGV